MIMGFYAYIYRDPTRQNEPFYVGKGKGSRAKYHLRRSDRHPLVQRIQHIKSLGKSPSIEVIQALDEDHSLFLEVCLIDVLGRKNLDKGPLLNLTDGGEGRSGTITSEETKAKLKLTQHLRGMNGRKHSQESKDLIASKVLGTVKGPRPNEVKAKISATKSEHPFVFSEELKLRMKGKRGPQRNPQKIGTCEHCGIVSRIAQLSRWHNDNCRYK
jgi:hypothetical protein